MPAPADANRETLILSGSLFAISVVLAARQVYDRRCRNGFDQVEAPYFRSRDRRRFLVLTVLVVIAGLLALSTRIEIHSGIDQARLWAWTMMGVLVLSLGLLVLALVDWRANHLHALRQGRALLEEHRALLADAIKRHHKPQETLNPSGKPGSPPETPD